MYLVLMHFLSLVYLVSRFHFMWEFLDLPWRDVQLLSKDEDEAQKQKAHL